MGYYKIKTHNAMSSAFLQYLESGKEQRFRIMELIRERFTRMRDSGREWKNIGYLSSFGTSGKRRFYEWGPNFKEHYHFFNELFYYGLSQWTYLRFSHAQFTKLHWNNPTLLTIYCSEDSVYPHDRYTFKDTCFCISPLYLYFFLRRFPSNLEFFDLKTCVFSLTGSELKPEHKKYFDSIGLQYRDFMRCWDSGATFFTCPFGYKHWVDVAFDFRWQDGNLLSTDLWNVHQPHIDYKTNDQVHWNRVGEKCECGLIIDEIHVSHDPKDIVMKDKVFKYDWVNSGINIIMNEVLGRNIREDPITILVGLQRHGEDPLHVNDKVVLISEEPITSEMHDGIQGQFWGMPIEVWSGRITGDFGRKLPRVFEMSDHPGVVELDQPIKT
jgi:hypothetical protein